MKTNLKGRGSTCTIEKNTNEKESTEKPKEKKKNIIIIKELKVKEEKKVHFSEDTVDNEHMGLKKSKSKFNLLNNISLLYI